MLQLVTNNISGTVHCDVEYCYNESVFYTNNPPLNKRNSELLVIHSYATIVFHSPCTSEIYIGLESKCWVKYVGSLPRGV